MDAHWLAESIFVTIERLIKIVGLLNYPFASQLDEVHAEFQDLSSLGFIVMPSIFSYENGWFGGVEFQLRVQDVFQSENESIFMPN